MFPNTQLSYWIILIYYHQRHFLCRKIFLNDATFPSMMKRYAWTNSTWNLLIKFKTKLKILEFQQKFEQTTNYHQRRHFLWQKIFLNDAIFPSMMKRYAWTDSTWNLLIKLVTSIYCGRIYVVANYRKMCILIRSCLNS